jgi:aspartate-semialdehyde dehydrogenase
MMEKIKVGILGATGMVGQRFIQLLEDHPWFEISELAASERSAGKPYGEAVSGRWKLETTIPDKTGSMMVKECKPSLDCKIVFSALDAEIAGTIEEDFAKAGYAVSSNSRNHRMDEDVPLLIPEVNAEHTAMIENQREKYNGKGYIVTNPNCSTIGLVLALAPLHKKYDIKKLIVTTLQALSGAGFPTLKGGKFVYADIKISASCNRVSVKDGHLECVSIAMDKKPSIDEIILALKEFNPLKDLNLPSSPPQPIIVKEEENRPQPKYDRDLGKGMSSIVGRIRECPVLDYKFLILSHNTIRGAAGAAILNAEYLKVKGLL